MVGIGILRGLTDVKVIMRNAFFAYIVINLPLSYLCTFTFGMGAAGVWLAFIFGLGTAAVLYYVRYRKIRHIKFAELQ